MGFMTALQQAGVLKVIVSSRCLSNYQDLFNLCHLVCQWCSATHSFFLSCGEITTTLEDMANQLLLSIHGDTDPNDMELSTEKEAVKAELKKRVSGNTKLSCWVGAFSKASIAIRRATFVTFWLYRFIFGSHLHYAIKHLYFRLAIQISTRVSLPLAPMFLGHLYF